MISQIRRDTHSHAGMITMDHSDIKVQMLMVYWIAPKRCCLAFVFRPEPGCSNDFSKSTTYTTMCVLTLTSICCLRSACHRQCVAWHPKRSKRNLVLDIVLLSPAILRLLFPAPYEHSCFFIRIEKHMRLKLLGWYITTLHRNPVAPLADSR